MGDIPPLSSGNISNAGARYFIMAFHPNVRNDGPDLLEPIQETEPTLF
jgi:hypothetical protein